MNKIKKGIKKCVLLPIKLALLPLVIVYMWWLNRKQPTKVSMIICCRIGHLALNTDLFLRNQKTLGFKQKTILIAPADVANDFLLERWSDIAEVVKYTERPIYARFLAILDLFRSSYFFELPYNANEYEMYHTTSSQFYLTESEKQEGDRILQEMGIGKDDWFVCVFARDNAYLDAVFDSQDKDGGSIWAYHDYRDSDIDTLNLAIDEILSRGGFVIRLGKIVEKEMSYKHPKVIDYPFSQWRSDFMDIYLQYRAKFVLCSSTSGATDVVSLFDTPYCGVNMPAYWNMPYKNVIQIPKTYRRNGQMVSLREWIKLVEIQKADRHYGCNYDDPTQLHIWHSDFYLHNNLEIINNTPEEILDLTKEMFERLDRNFEQSEEDKNLQEAYLKINETYLSVKDCKNPYGREFLRKNSWFLA